MVASEGMSEKKTGEGTTGVVEDGDDNGPEGTSRFIQDDRTLTSGEPGRSANVPSHSNEGDGRDGDVVVVVGEMKTRNWGAAAGRNMIVDEDDEDDSKGAKQTTADEPSKLTSSSDPEQSVSPTHPGEGGPDGGLVVASEGKHDKNAGGQTRAADDDHEDNGKVARQTTVDEPSKLALSSEPEKSAPPTHLYAGGPVVDSVVGKHGSGNENANSPEGGPSIYQRG